MQILPELCHAVAQRAPRCSFASLSSVNFGPLALLVAAVILSAAEALGQSQGADLVIYGKVHTMNPKLPYAEAIAISRGRIEAIGKRESMTPWIGAKTRIVNAPPKGAILPGIIESHAHLLGLGRQKRELELSAIRSPSELQAALSAHAAQDASAAILGRGWNHELWPDREFPTRQLLDAVLNDRPVFLVRVDGHAAVANSILLEAAGIDSTTKDPEGGRIERGPDGEPTGVLIDNAMGLVQSVLPRGDTDSDLIEDYLKAQEEALRVGITTFVDAGTDFDKLAILNRLYLDGRMKLRTYSMIGVNSDAELAVLQTAAPILNLHAGRANVRAIKLYADGALGSRGAWLRAPYSDRPDTAGFPVQDPAFIERVARFALARGWQVCVHAIGDRANQETLDAFARALKDAPDDQRLNHRFRIEHVQIIDPKDAQRLARLGVIASMQGCHCTSDAPWVSDRLGPERARSMAYSWRTLLDAGAILVNGTDAPVEPISPWRNFYATVTRNFQHPDGRWDRFHEEQRLSRFEALNSMTAWAALGIFAERESGQLDIGRMADLIIVDRDPMSAPLWEAARLNVRMTLIAGEIVHER